MDKVTVEPEVDEGDAQENDANIDKSKNSCYVTTTKQDVIGASYTSTNTAQK